MFFSFQVIITRIEEVVVTVAVQIFTAAVRTVEEVEVVVDQAEVILKDPALPLSMSTWNIYIADPLIREEHHRFSEGVVHHAFLLLGAHHL